MSFLSLFVIAVGLSMDAFAVSICKGLSLSSMSWKYAVAAGAYFGGFQALMPLAGYLLGVQFQDYITKVDHWIAFALLAFIGGKMVIEAIREKDGGPEEKTDALSTGELTVLAVATSIDALAVGITFAFLKVNILPSVLLIGVTTFALSLGGVLLGNRFGAKYKTKAEVAGGVILVLIGLKILLEHLGIINF